MTVDDQTTKLPASPPTAVVAATAGDEGGRDAEPPRRSRGARRWIATTTIGLVCMAVIAVSLVVLAVVGAIWAFDPFESEAVDRSGPTVLESIRELQDFTAAEGTFIQDVDIETDAKWMPSFLSGQRVVALVTGSVRGTVDFSGLADDAVNVSGDGKSISVNLPEPVLSDADIDESSARIISRDRGLIDRIDDFFAANPVDDGPLYAEAEKKVEAAARETDLLGEAKTNTEEWLTSFLRAAGFETVVISWERVPA